MWKHITEEGTCETALLWLRRARVLRRFALSSGFFLGCFALGWPALALACGQLFGMVGLVDLLQWHACESYQHFKAAGDKYKAG